MLKDTVQFTEILIMSHVIAVFQPQKDFSKTACKKCHVMLNFPQKSHSSLLVS